MRTRLKNSTIWPKEVIVVPTLTISKMDSRCRMITIMRVCRSTTLSTLPLTRSRVPWAQMRRFLRTWWATPKRKRSRCLGSRRTRSLGVTKIAKANLKLAFTPFWQSTIRIIFRAKCTRGNTGTSALTTWSPTFRSTCWTTRPMKSRSIGRNSGLKRAHLLITILVRFTVFRMGLHRISSTRPKTAPWKKMEPPPTQNWRRRKRKSPRIKIPTRKLRENQRSPRNLDTSHQGGFLIPSSPPLKSRKSSCKRERRP